MSDCCDELRGEIQRLRQEIAALDNRFIPQTERPVISEEISRAQEIAQEAKDIALIVQGLIQGVESIVDQLITTVQNIGRRIDQAFNLATEAKAIAELVRNGLAALQDFLQGLASLSALRALANRVNAVEAVQQLLSNGLSRLDGRVDRNTTEIDRVVPLAENARRLAADANATADSALQQVANAIALANAAQAEAIRARAKADIAYAKAVTANAKANAAFALATTTAAALAAALVALWAAINALGPLIAAASAAAAQALALANRAVLALESIARSAEQAIALAKRALDIAEAALAEARRFINLLYQLRQDFINLLRRFEELLNQIQSGTDNGDAMDSQLLQQLFQLQQQDLQLQQQAFELGKEIRELLSGEIEGVIDVTPCDDEDNPVTIAYGGAGLAGAFTAIKAFESSLNTIHADTKCPPDVTAALPMFFEVKRGEIPQLVVVWTKTENAGTSAWSMTIPHPRETIDKDYPFAFPTYRKGGNMASARLTDNSQIIVNASSEGEAQRVLDYVETLVDSRFIPDGGFQIIYSKNVADRVETDVKATYVKKYEGHKKGAPLWGVHLPSD